MTWVYDQTSGQIEHGGDTVAVGYAGAGSCKNDPYQQDIHNRGPIPRGLYTIGAPHDTPTHGPYVLRLEPDPTNDMCGRSGFLIHGDSVSKPGTASQGCIILPRAARVRIWESGDTDLEVI